MTGPSRRVGDDEILKEMALAGAPVVTVSKLAEVFDYSSENIRYRLGRLEDEGVVDSMRVGSSAKVYWLTDKGQERLAQR
jgi:DNA-binding transcriptional ArsR family regulator